MHSAVAVLALWMTAGKACTGYIRLGRWPQRGQQGAIPGGGLRPTIPHSRARARARVTMRTRIMRARGRARARARGDTPLRCSRIINGVEDYRFAVLGYSKNPGQTGQIHYRSWTGFNRGFVVEPLFQRSPKPGSGASRPWVLTHE